MAVELLGFELVAMPFLFFLTRDKASHYIL